MEIFATSFPVILESLTTQWLNMAEIHYMYFFSIFQVSYCLCQKLIFVGTLRVKLFYPTYHNYPKYFNTLPPYNIGIKHGFSCINIRQVLRFQHLTRDLANVNALKNHFWLLLLHKNWKHLLHFALLLALFCLAFSLMSPEWNFHLLCSL